MAIDELSDWHDRGALKDRIERQLEDMLLVKELLRERLLDRQQVEAALVLRRQIGVSLATSLLLNGGISLDVLAATLHNAQQPQKARPDLEPRAGG